MSEVSQGPGWWLASDGRWYPPEQHPDHQPIATPPPEPPAAPVAPVGSAGAGWSVPADRPTPPGGLPPAGGGSSPGRPRGGPSGGGGAGKLVVVALAVVLALVVGGIGLVVVLGGDDDESVETTSAAASKDDAEADDAEDEPEADEDTVTDASTEPEGEAADDADDPEDDARPDPVSLGSVEDQAIADAAVLTPADLEGWELTDSDDEDEADEGEDEDLDCPALASREELFDSVDDWPSAELEEYETTRPLEVSTPSGPVTMPGRRTLNNEVAIGPDVETTQEVFAVIASPELLGCLETAMSSSADTSDFTIEGVSSERLDVGDEGVAMHFTLNGDRDGKPMGIQMVWLFVRVDRGITMFMMSGADFQPDGSIVAPAPQEVTPPGPVQVAIGRLDAALAG